MRTLGGALAVVLVLGGCSAPANGGLNDGPQADEPALGTGEGGLDNLLAHSSREPMCPEPSVLEQARKSHVEEKRSVEARSAGQSARAGEWSLTPDGVSNGAVTLVVGKSIPTELSHDQGRDLLAHWEEQWRTLAKDGTDDFDAMEAGLIDQDGFRMLTMERIDARARLTHKDNVFGILPGPSLRTREGTGLGSTLAELEEAHGPYYMCRIPEPYHCSVYFPTLPHVSFLFRDCDKACLGDAVLEVYVGGYEGPEDELPWGRSP